MTERVSQEAVEAALELDTVTARAARHHFGPIRYAAFVQSLLQAALPALEADLREQLEAEVREGLENLHQDLVIEAGAEAEKVEDDPNAEDTPEFAASEAYIDAASRAANLARTFGTTEEESR